MNENHGSFAEHIIAQNKTPISEYVSSSQSHIVKYPQNNLILLAIRDNKTGTMFAMYLWTKMQVQGQYDKINELKEIAASYDIPGNFWLLYLSEMQTLL